MYWADLVKERDIALCATQTGDDWRRTEYPDYEPQEKIYQAVMLQTRLLARLLDHFKIGEEIPCNSTPEREL